MSEEEDLPEGWISAQLSDVIRGFESGRNLQAQGRPADGNEYGVLKVSAVTWGLFQPSENKALLPSDTPRPRELVRRGDVLISRANTTQLVGAPVIVREDYPRLMLPDKILRLVPITEIIDSEFLVYSLRTPAVRAYFEREATGTSDSMRNLSQPKIAGAPLDLPPLNEQRRIVAKIDALTARSRRAKEALDAIPALLERFRQSVLAAAFRGDLTAAWREKNPDVEPAEALLKRIRAERRRRWEEAELAKLRAKGKVPGDDRWKEKYEEPAPVDPSELPELPEGWAWATIDCLCIHVVDCLHRTPTYVEEGYPAIRTADVVRGRLLVGTARRVSEATYAEQIERLEPRPGDVLYTREGERFGLAALVPEGVKLCLSQRMMQFRTVPHIDSAYFMWALNSPSVYAQAVEDVGGSTSPHVNISAIKRFTLPIAPLSEQKVIARSIESSWSVSDLMECSLESVAERALALDRAILAKAFRGELVAQDPADEPAQALLERLRAEATPKTTAAPARKTTRKRP